MIAAPAEDEPPRPGGAREFVAMLVASFLAAALWIAAGLPRHPERGPPRPAPAWQPVHDPGARLNPREVETFRDESRRTRRRRGVEVEIHVAPEGADPGYAAGVVAARLGALEDARPRVLLVYLDGPRRVEVFSNQGLDAVFGDEFRDRKLTPAIAVMVRKGKVHHVVRAAHAAARRALDRALEAGDRDRFEGFYRAKWPRRWRGWDAPRWHRVTGGAFLGLVVLGVLYLLTDPTGRALLWPGPRAGPVRAGTWFRGGDRAGGFGGGVRAGSGKFPAW